MFRRDVRIDSPSRAEDVARILTRLGIQDRKVNKIHFLKGTQSIE